MARRELQEVSFFHKFLFQSISKDSIVIVDGFRWQIKKIDKVVLWESGASIEARGYRLD